MGSIVDRILIDTHVFIWAYEKGKTHNLGKKSKHLLSSRAVFVSSVSFAEIVIKAMSGKLEFNRGNEFADILQELGASELSFDYGHAHTIFNFESLAGHDPFDRMLLAQASAEGMIFVTADEVLLGLGLPFVVDARV